MRADEGTWRAFSALPNNPCLGKETPVTVSRSAPDQVILTVKYSQVLKDCQDARLVLSLDSGKLIGKFGDGRGIEVARD